MTSSAFALHGAMSPWLARLGLTLLHMIWEGTLVAAGLWFALAILRGRSPQARSLAGCGAALAMMVLMALTFLLVPATGTFAPSRSEEGRRMGAASVVSGTSASIGLSATDDVRVPNASHPQPAAGRRLFSTPGWKALVAWCHQRATLLPFLALAWAAGVLALGTRLVIGCAGVRRLCHHDTSAVESPWPQRLRALARRMRIDQPVSLRQSVHVATPAVVGWLRPVILLPVGMCAGLSTTQVEMILAHELAHIGRRDYLVNLLLNVAETVLFYHPAMWWIAALVREERENACDDLALAACDDDRLGYARALASLEEMRPSGSRLALAAVGQRGTLLARVRRLLGAPGARGEVLPSRQAACGFAGTAILSGAAAFLLIAGLVPARSQDAGSPTANSAEGASAPAGQDAEPPELAREQLVAHVKVTDETGQPVVGAEVRVVGIRPTRSGDYFDADKSSVVTLTDAQGEAAVSYPRYVEEKRTSGALYLTIKHPDFCARQAQWHVNDEQPASKPVVLVQGATLRVSGHLPGAANGVPHPTIYPKLSPDKQTLDTASTLDWQKAGDNDWEYRKVVPGNYHLQAAHASADGTIFFSDIQQITVVAGKTYAFDLELQRGERVAGRLDDSVPRPVVRGRVIAHVYASGPGEGAKQLYWDTWREVAADGTFVFESLPPGTVEMTAQCAGFVSANPPGGNRYGGTVTLPQPFVVAQGAGHAVVVEMEPAATVEVELRNVAGEPVGGAEICMGPNVRFTPGFSYGFNESLGRTEEALAAGRDVHLPADQSADTWMEAHKGRTDSAGRITIHDLPPGNHFIFLQDKDYESPPIMIHGTRRHEMSVELAPGETKHMTVRVQKKGTDPLTDRPPASTPAASPVPGPTVPPAPSPAPSTVPMPPTTLERT